MQRYRPGSHRQRHRAQATGHQVSDDLPQTRAWLVWVRKMKPPASHGACCSVPLVVGRSRRQALPLCDCPAWELRGESQEVVLCSRHAPGPRLRAPGPPLPRCGAGLRPSPCGQYSRGIAGAVAVPLPVACGVCASFARQRGAAAGVIHAGVGPGLSDYRGSIAARFCAPARRPPLHAGIPSPGEEVWSHWERNGRGWCAVGVAKCGPVVPPRCGGGGGGPPCSQGC